MRSVFILERGLVLATILLGCLVFPGCGVDRSARQQLRTDFERAHEMRDPDILMTLYALEGVRPGDIALLRMAAAAEVVLPLESVHFERPGPEDVIDFEVNGKTFEATLPIEWLMIVRYGPPERMAAAYPVGLRDGRAYLVTARPTDEKGV